MYKKVGRIDEMMNLVEKYHAEHIQVFVNVLKKFSE